MLKELSIIDFVKLGQEVPLNLGSLKIYSMRSKMQDDMDLFIDNYCWRDDASPMGYGPFVTLQECLDHYITIVKAYNGPNVLVMPAKVPEPVKSNVITVDFQSRRRIS